ncbi:MarR family winged helix-turn-helix transcriptional regulator [Amycolatopsis sp. NPDC051372]|uniref:MarR family winged helix-turn-helix transcriptional regulator n=1 Tax=unclassified Amycolatopsis TaxID=2618356 RepID=UPI0034446B0E
MQCAVSSRRSWAEYRDLITRHRAPDDERKVLIRLIADGSHRLVALRTELRARQFEALFRCPTSTGPSPKSGTPWTPCVPTGSS